MKITQGEAYWEFNPVSSLSPNGQITVKAGPAGTPICVLPIPLGGVNIKTEANAQLIVDAFNVRQQINFELPELKEVVKAATDQIHELVRINHRLREFIEEVVEIAEQHGPGKNPALYRLGFNGKQLLK